MFLYRIFFLVCLLSPFLNFKEPPTPWESYNAILTADNIIIGTIDKTEIIELSSPYFTWKEKRVLASVKVNKIISQESNLPLIKQQRIKILIPSLLEFNELASEYNPQIVSFPSFFTKNKCFIAALVWNEQNKWFETTSDWANFSFLEDSKKQLNAIYSKLNQCQFSKKEAEQIACKYFLSSQKRNCPNISLKVIGAEEKNNQIVVGNENTLKTKLFWYVQNPIKPEQFIYIDCITGELKK